MDFLVTIVSIYCISARRRSWLKNPVIVMLLISWLSPIILRTTLPYGGSGFPTGWYIILGNLEDSQLLMFCVTGLTALFMFVTKQVVSEPVGAAKYSDAEKNRKIGFEESTSNFLILISNYIFLILYVVGQGASILYRENYLFADGNTTLRTFTTLLGPMWFFITLILVNQKRLGFIQPIVLFLGWELVLLAKGSRFSILIILSFSIFLYQKAINKYVKYFLVTTTVPLILLTFYFLDSARKGNHGLTQIPDIITRLSLQELFSFDLLKKTGFQLFNSLFSIVPNMEITLKSDIARQNVWWQFNPLPRALLGENLNEINLTPWLPASGLGVIVVSLGLAAGLLYVFTYLLAIEVLQRNLAFFINDKKSLRLVASALYFAGMIVMWQYSIRWSFRVFTVIVLTSLLLGFLARLRSDQKLLVTVD